MKMLDYVQLAHVRMGENLERSSELVAQLVDIFQSGSFNALRIVASGSSRHAADCARDYLQDALQMQVSVVDGIEAAAKQGNAAHFRSMTGFFGLRRYSTNRLPMTCTTSEPVCSASCSAASRAV